MLKCVRVGRSLQAENATGELPLTGIRTAPAKALYSSEHAGSYAEIGCFAADGLHSAALAANSTAGAYVPVRVSRPIGHRISAT